MVADHDHRRGHRRADTRRKSGGVGLISPPGVPAESSPRLAGIALVISGALLIASKGIFAKFLYARGVDFQTVVALRAVLAIPGFVIVVWLFGGLERIRRSSWSERVGAGLAGLLSYYFGAWINFLALTMIDASVERAILFTYPALVVLAAWIMTGRRPGFVVATAIAATYAGTALTVGVFDRELLEKNLIGALLVLVCAATIAIYFLISARLTRSMGSGAFTVIAMTTAGSALAVHYQLAFGWQQLALDGPVWALMIGLVVFATVLPIYLIAEGVRLVGAQRAAIASTVGPPATALMAFALLGETLRLAQLAGILLIVGGILLLEMRQSNLD